MKTLEQRQWRPTGVFIVNCELFHEQANVCWVYIEKTTTFEDKIGCIMHYVVVS